MLTDCCFLLLNWRNERLSNISHHFFKGSLEEVSIMCTSQFSVLFFMHIFPSTCCHSKGRGNKTERFSNQAVFKLSKAQLEISSSPPVSAPDFIYFFQSQTRGKNKKTEPVCVKCGSSFVPKTYCTLSIPSTAFVEMEEKERKGLLKSEFMPFRQPVFLHRKKKHVQNLQLLLLFTL